MSKIVPSSRPKQERAESLKQLSKAGVRDKVALIGVRGYYLNTMGKAGKNDRGIYDDAIILVAPEAHVAFNANVDPSVSRKHIANLAEGVWLYKIGIHGLSRPVGPRRYKALVQAGPVTVIRDEEGPDTGWFGINIHKGSYSTTSSIGCQTLYPDQWPSFIALVESQMKKHEQKTIPYLLRV